MARDVELVLILDVVGIPEESDCIGASLDSLNKDVVIL